MNVAQIPFEPPAPKPRTVPPNIWQMMRILYRNPIELWGHPSYNEPYVHMQGGIGGPLLIANDPELIRHILVEDAKKYRMARVRQLVLRPILKDGLLTAEGHTWKRSRKAMAPVFTPRQIFSFAPAMLAICKSFSEQYEESDGPFDVSHDMTLLTFEILAETLFSKQVVGSPETFGEYADQLFETGGRIDPLDIVNAPEWIPRVTRLRARRPLAYFRQLVSETVKMRRKLISDGKDVPDDFLSLLLRQEGPDGLSPEEIEDNVITFIGAGHETTSRALGWTIYLLSNAPNELDRVVEEGKSVHRHEKDPAKWLGQMPYTRAAFEEAMRLYPPAPTISREAIEDIRFGELEIKKGTQVLIMPWTLHRHRLYWDDPDRFKPSRFLPENREKLHRFQYLPFGAGPRICIGASFALQEAVIALGVLLSRFRFEMAPDAPQPWPVQKLTTQPEGGLRMSVRKL